MSTIGLILFLIGILGMIIGLIKPGIVIRWGATKTRGRALLTYGIVFIAGVVLILNGMSDFEKGEGAMEHSNYEYAVDRFSAVKPSDKDYAEAQRLLPEAKEKLAQAQQKKAEDAAIAERDRQEKAEKKQAEKAQREANAQAKENEREAAEQAAIQAKINSLPLVTAVELEQAYDDNPVGANVRFKNKKFRISGVVTNISNGFGNDPYIVLHGIRMFSGPKLRFNKNELDTVGTLRKGMTVTVVCTGSGDFLKMPVLNNCYFP